MGGAGARAEESRGRSQGASAARPPRLHHCRHAWRPREAPLQLRQRALLCRGQHRESARAAASLEDEETTWATPGYLRRCRRRHLSFFQRPQTAESVRARPRGKTTLKKKRLLTPRPMVRTFLVRASLISALLRRGGVDRERGRGTVAQFAAAAAVAPVRGCEVRLGGP